jgi:predicted ATPase
MIAGIFLRYIKTYRGYNYIPLVSDDRFCGLVGNNGIGKSSILEALDALFNDKQLNLNIVTKRSGYSETNPHVVPVFLVHRDDLSGNLAALAETLNTLAMGITEADVPVGTKNQIRKFIQHRTFLVEAFRMEEYYLVPIGIDRSHVVALSLFNCRKLVELRLGVGTEASVTVLDESQLMEFTPLLDKLKSSIDYIYIPKEIDSDAFTKLETKEIQSLMGESLNQIIEGLVSADVVRDINSRLNHFLDDLSTELVDYSYRTRTDRQQNLKKQDVYNLIVQAFFNIRMLHKQQPGGAWLEINSLSSGEKQKAIIDVAHSLIKNHRTSGENLILAVDEPESSLHMSACFDQFAALYEISRFCRQLLFATHWYGFFPTIESGSAAVITKTGEDHVVDLINLANHREQVRQMARGSRGTLPYDVRLKSINDFVQSIITSAIGSEPYSWLICEGSSEKVYLSAYLKDLIEEKRLRIIPVGGAKEVKRLYQHISVSYEEFKEEVTGKIYLLSDTDAELVQYDVRNSDNLLCRRMVTEKSTKSVSLVNINSNPVSPKTEIEDVLNGKLFYNTLKAFISDNPGLGFLNDYGAAEDVPSFFALDLRESERTAIEQFFDAGNNKFIFAEKYVAGLTPELEIPGWITTIRNWLTSTEASAAAAITSR